MPLQITELLQPIAGANPGGADVRYDPIFDQIKRARIEEDDLPTGDWSRDRKTADYALVVKLSTEVLGKQSKDLQIAAWLTEALLKREGLGGLRSGLELLAGLLSNFWDHLYPEIEDDELDFRVAPLDWVGQYLVPTARLVAVNRTGHNILNYRESRSVGYEADAGTMDKANARKEALAAGKLSAEEFDRGFDETPKAWYKSLIADIEGTLVAIDALDKIGQEKFGRDAPRYSPLRDVVVEVRQVSVQLLAKKLETDPDPIEVVPVAAEEEFLAGGAAAGEAAGAGGLPAVPRSRADAESRIAQAARFLRSERPTDPASYLLLRGFRWGELRAHAGNVDPKLLAAPPTELRARLRGFLLDARWPELLEHAEDVMSSAYGRGWLDLQRYVLSACSGLGSDYDQVAATIQGALQALLRDVPQLPALTLMDDTPTANAETQGWLHNLMGAAGDAPAASAVMPVNRTAGASGHGLYERAMDRVRAGEPERAIEMLIQQATQERSARERFLRRSQAARIMVDVGREAVALPILEDLVAEIEKHSLEEWESGDTVAQPMGLLYRALIKTQGESSDTNRLYLRICRLDPMLAIEITS